MLQCGQRMNNFSTICLRLYGVFCTSLGLPLKFFHYGFDCFDVESNSTGFGKFEKGYWL